MFGANSERHQASCCGASKQSIQMLGKVGTISLHLKMKLSSGHCIVKETVWNRPEKVDHLAYKNLCVLQGSGIISSSLIPPPPPQ